MRIWKVLLFVVLALLFVGVTMPWWDFSRPMPEENRTRMRIKSLIMASKQYETQYGVLPFDREVVLSDAEYDQLIDRLCFGKNTRGIRFLEPIEGGYTDVWGRRLQVKMDANYDNSIRLAQVSGQLYTNVAVWSLGEDPESTFDDVASWD